MHLGYHELRNMLVKFKEERENRKMAPPTSLPSGAPAAASGGIPPALGGAPPRGDRDFRSSRDDFRERDRGYDRHGPRYE